MVCPQDRMTLSVSVKVAKADSGAVTVEPATLLINFDPLNLLSASILNSGPMKLGLFVPKPTREEMCQLLTGV